MPLVPALPQHPRLLPGLSVLRRDADHLQVGVGSRAVVLPDHPDVRRLLTRLAPGGPDAATDRPAPDSPAGRALARLVGAALLVDGAALHAASPRAEVDPVAERAVAAAWCADPRSAPRRWAARRDVGVHLDVPAGDRPGLTRLIGASGVPLVDGVRERSPDTPVLVVRDREPLREELDVLQRDDVPHLLVRPALDRVVLGPFVAPGRTACLRCLDAHATELDPRWPLLVEQLARSTVVSPCDPTLWQVATGWAVHDLVRWLDGEQPSTWSTTITLGPGLAPEVRVHRRHPRCGCGWAELGGRHDGPAPGHQKSESSLPSIERRFSREQVSQ